MRRIYRVLRSGRGGAVGEPAGGDHQEPGEERQRGADVGEGDGEGHHGDRGAGGEVAEALELGREDEAQVAAADGHAEEDDLEAADHHHGEGEEDEDSGLSS